MEKPRAPRAASKKKPLEAPAYDPAAIEKKWQKKWAALKVYKSQEAGRKEKGERRGKFYVLDMFPYPSGEGLHVGHPKGYIATDVVSRMKRMQGKNVLHPMGFDAFGLPAENYAIKTKTDPEIAVKKNVARFKEQLEVIGLDYDWSREVNTTDPAYYKWTQWAFLQMWKRGLAFESYEPVNWCPTDKTVLSNEDVENGRCERCGTPVEKKPLRQWVLKITDYADRLLRDLDAVEAPIFTNTTGSDAFRTDMPVSERHVVHCLIKHWKDDSFLCMKWKKNDWRGFVIGGIEDGESVRETALREVMEETGYKNASFKRVVSRMTAEFYQQIKKENRRAFITTVYIELQDGERGEVPEHEKDIQDMEWVPREQVREFVNRDDLKYEWDVFTGAIEQKPLLDWPESIKEAQRNWIGRSEGAEIDFRLKVASQKTRFVLVHGYKGSPKDDFFPWLKAELEKRGHEVEAPELPGRNDPREKEQVEHLLKSCRFDEDTVLVGHSLGGVVAMKALMKLDKPISGLVLVAPAIEPGFSKDAKPRAFHKTFTWDYDYGRIKELTGGKIAVLSDLTEDHRAPYLKHLAGKLSARLIETRAILKHFNGAEEPDILKAVTPSVTVFTTRPDTLYGVTYVVLAPEHPWVKELLPQVVNRAEAEAYIAATERETDIERTDASKEKTGVELKGIHAVNPANGEEVPVWIADYVLSDYGTGAVMAVPSHDDRDLAFAKKFGLPVKQVIIPEFGIKRPNEQFADGGCSIVFDPVAQRYAAIETESGGEMRLLLPSGGMKPGEDPRTTVLRETEEETGLHDFKSIENMGEVNAHYHHQSKNLDRVAHATCLLIVANSTKTKPTKLEDHEKKMVLKWVTADEAIASWNKREDHGAEHWIHLMKQGVGRLIERGIDTTSDKSLYKETAFTGAGTLMGSGPFTGKDSDSVKKEIAAAAGGRWVTRYKLRDWVFSRQRYWGEPIPLIHCEKCGVVPVPEKDLPVKLPKVESYEPTGTGESPLASIAKWVNVKCPRCGGKGRRETNTMPQWAGSCWYYLRYMDPKNRKELVDRRKEEYWSPVDLYVGGAEHATRHLIYARFWHKFLYDIGAVSGIEPFAKLQSVGLIMGEDGRKMSKRFGNVVNPDDIVKAYGADTLRVYEMFMGPFDQSIAWSTKGIAGPRRFIERVWRLADKAASDKGDAAAARIVNKAAKKVADDIDGLRFNTAISSLMIAANELEKLEEIGREAYEAYVKLLAPFAPHAAEELWARLGNKGSIHVAAWPAHDPALDAEGEQTIILQVNGKTRGSFKAGTGAGNDELERLAKASPEAARWTAGTAVARAIVVPGRLVNLIVVDK